MPDVTTLPPLPFRAFIFDFDGTLARLNIDFQLMRQAVCDLIASHGVPVDGLADLFVLEMIEEAARRVGRDAPSAEEAFRAEALRRIETIEMDAARTGGLLEGTKPLLAALKDRRVKTCVVSRNCRAAIALIFPDIGELCDAVVPREGTARVKPHPEHLRTALEALRVLPAEAAMVGDHPIDIRAGRDAGLFTIGVLTGAAGRERLCEARPDLVLEKAADIIGLI
jgi:phosphoglycolate phosphatase